MKPRTFLLVCLIVGNALATHPPLPDNPKLPWLLSSGIVDELMVNTAVPEAQARLIFEKLQTSHLKQLERLKDSPNKTAFDGAGGAWGPVWFSYMACLDHHFEILKMWKDSGWQDSNDIDWSVKATETITFYADHWEQVNASGIFVGKIAPYVAPSVAPAKPIT